MNKLIVHFGCLLVTFTCGFVVACCLNLLPDGVFPVAVIVGTFCCMFVIMYTLFYVVNKQRDLDKLYLKILQQINVDKSHFIDVLDHILVQRKQYWKLRKMVEEHDCKLGYLYDPKNRK